VLHRVHTTLKNPVNPWKNIFTQNTLGKPLEFLYYPWKTLEKINDAKDKE
jgi:hypothetical protein